MKKLNILSALFVLFCFEACTKSTDPAVVTPASTDPKKGSVWVYKSTYYNQAGTVTSTNNTTYIGDTLTSGGSVWILLKESVSGLPAVGIQKRADGWWYVPFPNVNASLWFKTPAVVGDKYNYNISDGTVDTSKVMNINATLTVPAGTYTGCTYIQSFDTNSMEDEYYFLPTGAILMRTGTFDDKVPGPGIYEKQRTELVSFVQ